jgi:hypothetical protein
LSAWPQFGQAGEIWVIEDPCVRLTGELSVTFERVSMDWLTAELICNKTAFVKVWTLKIICAKLVWLSIHLAENDTKLVKLSGAAIMGFWRMSKPG